MNFFYLYFGIRMIVPKVRIMKKRNTKYFEPVWVEQEGAQYPFSSTIHLFLAKPKWRFFRYCSMWFFNHLYMKPKMLHFLSSLYQVYF